jgi:hypothetical protein
MPLTDKLMDVVVKVLQLVNPGPKRRLAFDALRPVLNLADDEMDMEFDRVTQVLRYLQQLDRDKAALRKIHTHKLSCRAQSAIKILRHII